MHFWQLYVAKATKAILAHFCPENNLCALSGKFLLVIFCRPESFEFCVSVHLPKKPKIARERKKCRKSETWLIDLMFPLPSAPFVWLRKENAKKIIKTEMTKHCLHDLTIFSLTLLQMPQFGWWNPSNNLYNININIEMSHKHLRRVSMWYGKPISWTGLEQK